jgi:DNA-directed RNA polymerase subunit L
MTCKERNAEILMDFQEALTVWEYDIKHPIDAQSYKHSQIYIKTLRTKYNLSD